jgi:thiol-disulfide isomerase/thioredoxin
MQRLFTLAALGASLAPLALAVQTPGDAPVKEAPKSEHRWFAEFDTALAAAKAEGKDLFVDFTGSEWCPPCIALHDEVLAQEVFYAAASKQFVLVALDFPRDPASQAKIPHLARNEEVRQKYEVEQFPTVLLMNADGEVFGTAGYRAGGPQKYADFVGVLAKSGKALLAAGKTLPAAYEAAEDKLAVVREATTVLGAAVEGAAGANVVAKIVRHAFELDPQNEAGHKVKALAALVKVGAVEAGDLELADELDPKNEHGALEYALAQRIMSVEDEASATAVADRALAFAKLAAEVNDKEALQRPLLSVIYWCHNPGMLNRVEDGKTLLAYARELGEVPQDLLDAIKE